VAAKFALPLLREAIGMRMTGPMCSGSWNRSTDRCRAPAILRSGCAVPAAGIFEYQLKRRRIHGWQMAQPFLHPDRDPQSVWRHSPQRLADGVGRIDALRQLPQEFDPHRYQVTYLAKSDFGRLDL